MRMILEIREIQKRPKLADFLAIYKEQLKTPGAVESEVKKEFQNKFKLLYSYDSD